MAEFQSNLGGYDPEGRYASAASPLDLEELLKTRAVSGPPPSSWTAWPTPAGTDAGAQGSGTGDQGPASPQQPSSPAPQPKMWTGGGGGTGQKPDYSGLAMSQLNQGSSDLTAAEQAAQSPPPDTSQLQDLNKRITAASVPTQMRENRPEGDTGVGTGKVLPQFKASFGQKVLRGLRSGAVGLLTGGIRGGLLGAIEPQDVAGGTAYGAPNKAYQQAETDRGDTLANLEAQRPVMSDALKMAIDQRKQQIDDTEKLGSQRMGAVKDLADLGKADASNEKNVGMLRKAGFKMGPDGGIMPLDRSEMSQDQQARMDLDSARQEEASATAELRRAQNDPTSPAYQAAMARIDNARRNGDIAMQRLSLSQQEFQMHSRGTDAQGNPLPGALTESDGTPVGTAFQANVRPTETQRDAAGRAVTMDTLQQKILAGMQDPEIRRWLGPAAGRMAEISGKLGTLPAKVAEFKNDLVSYGAFQAGLHPVRGIGALHYFDQVMGGMGQTPEQLEGKLRSNASTSKSVQQVGTPHVAPAGGAQPAGPGAAKPGGADNFFSRYTKASKTQ